ncbi:hypothetical protein D3C86_1342470 [compost metagenome]
MQHPGEVFAAHEFGGIAIDRIGTDQINADLPGEFGFGCMVDQHRVGRTMFDARTATETPGLGFDDCAHAFEGLLAHLGIQCPQAQAQDCLLWNDVGRLPRLQRAHRDHRRLLRIDVARNHGLQGHDHAGRRHQRIDRQMRHRTVAADTFDGHVKQILRGHHRPLTKTQMTGG